MPPLTPWDPAGLLLVRPRVDLADLSSPVWSGLGNNHLAHVIIMFFNSANLCKMNILTSFISGGFIFDVMCLTLLFDCFWINENLPIAGKLINHKCRNGAQVVTQEHWESDLQFVPSFFFHFQIETFALGLSFYLVHRIESGTLSKLKPSDLRWSFHLFSFLSFDFAAKALLSLSLVFFFSWYLLIL